ncbi:hypothetical protein MANES_01G069050v8 [Manihot esculenta]|uniref:Uncharacterized protein n=1 Tax=Manihot esculenta TaxID=3983 RepID=A0ACB7ICJ6_MANES|nr:hypothetical protein MANES_01G069050v8 [Manihot esculenta]
MKMALTSKNKIKFIDGSLPLAKIDLISVIWIDKSVGVWNDLKDRFSQGDMICIFYLQEEIYSFKQGELYVTDYFNQLKILWDEFINFWPHLACTCVNPCNCGAVQTGQQYMKNDYVIRFLKGRIEQYANVKSQILMMEPLPSINKVFSLVLQQERNANKCSIRSKGFCY